MLRSGQDSFAVVGAGIKLLECSPQPAVRCVIVPSALGYTLISCCCLFLCIRWLKTSVRQDGESFCFAFPSVCLLLLCVCAVAQKAVDDTHHC
ncbi:hypothetical protein DPL33_03195 [Escherichia coli]|nr:hypothetical protein [Escherichia coli]